MFSELRKICLVATFLSSKLKLITKSSVDGIKKFQLERKLKSHKNMCHRDPDDENMSQFQTYFYSSTQINDH